MSKTTPTPSPTATPQMAAPALFFSMDGKQLRVIVRDEDPWFVAADVCAALDYKNTSKAVADHLEDDEKGVTTGYTLGGEQRLTIISESGLYTLVLRSRKPEARRFRRWVTHEVLPSIRRTGSYSVKRQAPLERQIGRCQTLIRDIERSKSKFCRDGLLALAGLAFADVGLPMPDLKGLHPLQLPLVPEGGAA